MRQPEVLPAKKVHFQGTDMVPPTPGTKGWDRVIARGCGGYHYYTMDGPDFDCHHYTWSCDECPVCIVSQEEKHNEWLNDMATVQGPPRRYPPEKWQTEIWSVWPRVESELWWIKEDV